MYLEPCPHIYLIYNSIQDEDIHVEITKILLDSIDIYIENHVTQKQTLSASAWSSALPLKGTQCVGALLQEFIAMNFMIEVTFRME